MSHDTTSVDGRREGPTPTGTVALPPIVRAADDRTLDVLLALGLGRVEVLHRPDGSVYIKEQGTDPDGSEWTAHSDLNLGEPIPPGGLLGALVRQFSRHRRYDFTEDAAGAEAVIDAMRKADRPCGWWCSVNTDPLNKHDGRGVARGTWVARFHRIGRPGDDRENDGEPTFARAVAEAAVLTLDAGGYLPVKALALLSSATLDGVATAPTAPDLSGRPSPGDAP
jgi:hypothetical protein